MRLGEPSSAQSYRRGAILGLTIGEVFMLLAFVLLLLMLFYYTQTEEQSAQIDGINEELLNAEAENTRINKELANAISRLQSFEMFEEFTSEQRRLMLEMSEKGWHSVLAEIVDAEQSLTPEQAAVLLKKAMMPLREDLLDAVEGLSKTSLIVLASRLKGSTDFEHAFTLLDQFGGLDRELLAHAVTLARTARDEKNHIVSSLSQLPPDKQIIAMTSGVEVANNANLNEWNEIAETLEGVNWDPETLGEATKVASMLGKDPIAALKILKATYEQNRKEDERRALDIGDVVRVTLEDDVTEIGGTISKDGSITLPSSTLFSQGSAELPPKMQNFLKKICLPWLNALNNVGFEVAEIRVEGHASTEARGDERDRYLTNLGLSQNRARAVLAYCLGVTWGEEVNSWARQRAVAIGFSSSKLVLDDDGNENKIASRRVVLSADPARFSTVLSLD